jgi:hypothetical protein
MATIRLQQVKPAAEAVVQHAAPSLCTAQHGVEGCATFSQ